MYCHAPSCVKWSIIVCSDNSFTDTNLQYDVHNCSNKLDKIVWINILFAFLAITSILAVTISAVKNVKKKRLERLEKCFLSIDGYSHTWGTTVMTSLSAFTGRRVKVSGDSLLQRGVVAERKVTKSKNGDCDSERTYINTSLEQNEQMMIMTKRKTQMIKHITIFWLF